MKNTDQLVTRAEELFRNRENYKELLSLLTDKKLTSASSSRLYVIKGIALRNYRGKTKAGSDFRVRTNAALSYFDEAIRLDKNNFEAYRERAKIYIFSGRKKWEAARTDFAQAIKLNPNDPESYIGRARLWRVLKQNKKMKADLEMAVKANPKDPKGYYLRSDFWRIGNPKFRNIESSVKDLLAAVRLDKKPMPASYVRIGNPSCPTLGLIQFKNCHYSF